ncbi:hypothetical protein BDZ91DRAFT_853231 [Kalaharituber pfeilii]|nr:hypothetical protein BDZ91DRAFT_853231 [Kalaharituber pfeilii]
MAMTSTSPTKALGGASLNSLSQPEETLGDLLSTMWQYNADIMTNLLGSRELAISTMYENLRMGLFSLIQYGNVLHTSGAFFKRLEDRDEMDKIEMYIENLRNNFVNVYPDKEQFVRGLELTQKEVTRAATKAAFHPRFLNYVIQVFELIQVLLEGVVGLETWDTDSITFYTRLVQRTLTAAYWIRWRWFNTEILGGTPLDTKGKDVVTEDNERDKGGNICDLDTAIQLLKHLVGEANNNDPDAEGQQSIDMTQLSLLLHARYQYTRNAEDLEEGLMWGKAGIELSADMPGGEDTPVGLHYSLRDMWTHYSLAVMEGHKYEYTRDPNGLDEARNLAKAAQEFRSTKHLKRLMHKNGRELSSGPSCTSLRASTQQAGSITNIDLLVRYFEEQMDRDPSNAQINLWALGYLYQARNMAHQSGSGYISLENLYQEEALLRHMPDKLVLPSGDSVEFQSVHVRMGAYRKLYEQTKDPKHRDAMIALYEADRQLDKLVIYHQYESHAKTRFDMLFHISQLYLNRFKNGGPAHDIESAIAVAADAVCSVDEGDDDKPAKRFIALLLPLAVAILEERLDIDFRRWCLEQKGIAEGLMLGDEEFMSVDRYEFIYRHALRKMVEPGLDVSERLEAIVEVGNMLWGDAPIGQSFQESFFTDAPPRTGQMPGYGDVLDT